VLYLTEPERLGEALGDEPSYRATQLSEWLYHHPVMTTEAMTNLPGQMRADLADKLWPFDLELEQVGDGGETRKWLFRTEDGSAIETVLMGYASRTTLCISSQVGCAMGCTFCATGQFGFDRHLDAGEIFAQVAYANAALSDSPLPRSPSRVTNVVFMGMGEPLLNLPAVSEAIRTLIHPKAFALAPRRITVSTAGVVSKIRPLLELAPVNLAVSLHATTDAVRDELVPLNRKVPLATLLETLRSEPLINRRRPVFFEYTLMEGVNDSVEDARRLPGLIRGIASKVNVIPMNPHPDAPYKPPSDEVVDRFTATLHSAGVRVTLRRDRGRDIDAACGQLANRSATRAQEITSLASKTIA